MSEKIVNTFEFFGNEKIKELENSINNIDGTSNLVLAALLQYI